LRTRGIVGVLVALLAMAGHAGTIDVGGMDLEIPAPEGFVRVTPQMGAAHRFGRQLADPLNDLLAFYIPESCIPAAILGERSAFTRYFLFKINREIRDRVVDRGDFETLKEALKSENRRLAAEDGTRIEELIRERLPSLGEESGAEPAFPIPRLAPLEPHEETGNLLAYSMLLDAAGPGGNGGAEGVAVTMTLLHVSGKVLFLYCYAPPEELEWTREASSRWARAILEGNPSEPPPPGLLSRFDWLEIASNALVGAAVAALLSLISAHRARRRKGDMDGGGGGEG